MPKINLASLLMMNGETAKTAYTTMEGARDAIKASLIEGVDVSIPGLGIFHIVERAARVVRNPHGGSAINIPARRSVIFRPAAGLKRALNDKKESDE